MTDFEIQSEADIIRDASDSGLINLWRHATDSGDISTMMACRREHERRQAVKAGQAQPQAA